MIFWPTIVIIETVSTLNCIVTNWKQMSNTSEFNTHRDWSKANHATLRNHTVLQTHVKCSTIFLLSLPHLSGTVMDNFNISGRSINVGKVLKIKWRSRTRVRLIDWLIDWLLCYTGQSIYSRDIIFCPPLVAKNVSHEKHKICEINYFHLCHGWVTLFLFGWWLFYLLWHVKAVALGRCIRTNTSQWHC